MPAVVDSPERPLVQCVARVQALAGQVLDTDPLELIRAVPRIADGMPDRLTPRDVVLARHVLARTLTYLAARQGVAGDPRVTRAFTEFAGAAASPHWRADVHRLTESCILAAGAVSPGTGPRSESTHVRRALAIIEARYREATLTPARVAKECNISAAYLCQLFNRLTARDFWTHVHDVRVAAAWELLTESPLQVQEVAAVVGYDRVATFRRRFDARHGVSPRLFRARRHSTHSTPAVFQPSTGVDGARQSA